MQPLCTARVSNLKAGDFVIVECASCSHDGLIRPAALPSLGLGPDERITDLAPRLRCRKCDARGKAERLDQMGGPSAGTLLTASPAISGALHVEQPIAKPHWPFPPLTLAPRIGHPLWIVRAAR